MKDTPTKATMNIYLLTIPFAILGVAVAVVPLIIGMRHDARTRPEKMDQQLIDNPFQRHREKDYEHAA